MSTLNKSIFAHLAVAIIGILLATPIIGSFSNASASTVEDSFMPFSQPEELQQQQEDGGGGETAPPSPPLTASITIDSTDGDTAPATFLFEASAEGGTEPYTFLWDFGDGQQSDIANIEHTFEQAGIYVVSLTVTDSAGQTASDRREVNVRPTTTTEEPQVPTNATTPQPTEPEQIPNQTSVEQNQTGANSGPICAEIHSGNPTPGSSPPRDSLNEFLDASSGNWQPAYVIIPTPTPYHLIAGTNYISMEQNTEGPTNSDTWYRASFTLPSSFLNPSLNVRIHADNYAEIYLNSPPNNLADPAHLVGMQPNQQIVDNFRDPPESFTANTPLQPGTNTIYFKIHNFDETTAFDYQVKVYCRMVPGGGLGPGPIGNVSGPLPPTTSGNVTCPAKNVQHWDKIVFQITDSGVAGSLGFLTDTPLDIKVLDDPKTVADIEKKVLDFLKLPDNPQNRNAIFVVDVEYAIICAR